MIHLRTRDMLIVLVALLGVHAQLVPRHVVIAIMAMGGGLVVFVVLELAHVGLSNLMMAQS